MLSVKHGILRYVDTLLIIKETTCIINCTIHYSLSPSPTSSPSLQHFVCAYCEEAFEGRKHFEKKGLAYCERDFKNVSESSNDGKRDKCVALLTAAVWRCVFQLQQTLQRRW